MFGVTGIFFAAMYQGVSNEMAGRSAERETVSEMRMLQLGERVKLIDFVGSSPATADVMNVGVAAVSVRHVLVDGAVSTASMQLMHNGSTVHVIPVGEVVRITAGGSGSVLVLISENDKAYVFGE